MNAFIYAAGRAMRLGPAFADTPKILIEFGGKSLLEWHVQRLTELGVKKLVVVTGHQRELIRATFASLQERYRIKIKEVVNKDYTEGSVLSFYASLPKLLGAPTPVLLMDGDVLYPAEILRRVVKSPRRTVLLIDRNYSKLDDDPVLVPIRAGKPFEFLKKWRGTADLIGESIGFFKIDSADIPLLVEETRKRSAGERRGESYDEVIRALVLAGRFDCEDVTGIPWTEIDFPEDIEFARRKVLPEILK
jgi:choline kinase